MNWSQATFRMPLQGRPKLWHLAVGVHGPRPDRFYLPDFWSLHFYRYHGELVIDGRAFPIRPGHASITPQGARVTYRYAGRAEHIYAHFSFTEKVRRLEAVPAMVDLGADFQALNAAVEAAVGFFPSQPLRAEVRIWDLLWALRERAGAPAASAPLSVFQQASRLIELRLNQELYLAELAREIGISHNHLTRVFREQSGLTPVAYIRQRRAARARHLLIHTMLPIKTIAAGVGLPDAGAFNKTIRRELGRSPRQVRGGFA